MDLKSLGSKNILIVEDDTFNMKLLTSIFKKVSEMNIISVFDGEAALEKLNSKKEKIDMLLLDIRIPIVNGIEVIEKIKVNPELKDLPIIVISVDSQNEEKLKEMGVNDFILKPFDIEELISKISKFLK